MTSAYSTRHYRSKSAYDNNLEFTRHGTSYRLRKGYCKCQLRVYTAQNVLEELEMARNDFLQANVLVKKSRKIFLPKLLDIYAKEATLTCVELVGWACANIDKKLNDAILKCNNVKNKRVAQAIEWLPYNSKFRYVFGKDLTEKPWWV